MVMVLIRELSDMSNVSGFLGSSDLCEQETYGEWREGPEGKSEWVGRFGFADLEFETDENVLCSFRPLMSTSFSKKLNPD